MPTPEQFAHTGVTPDLPGLSAPKLQWHRPRWQKLGGEHTDTGTPNASEVTTFGIPFGPVPS